jgi:hypothetical protein
MTTFTGFTHSDFSDLIDGVHWMGRGALGGVLARGLNDTFGGGFSSWGVRRRTELHLARASRYIYRNPWPHAKLFVYSRPDEVAFGFYVEKPDQPLGQDWDWLRFLGTLESDPIARAALLAAIRNHGLTLTDYYNQDTGGALGRKILYWQDKLCWQRPQEDPEPITIDDLVRLLQGLKHNTWCDLHCFAAIPKAEAIALGDHIVVRILTVFRSLVPVYEAATTDKGA